MRYRRISNGSEVIGYFDRCGDYLLYLCKSYRTKRKRTFANTNKRLIKAFGISRIPTWKLHPSARPTTARNIYPSIQRSSPWSCGSLMREEIASRVAFVYIKRAIDPHSVARACGGVRMGVARGTRRCLILRGEWEGLVMAAPAVESWRPCGAELPNFDLNLLTLI
jgi:hypothetical protein